MEPSVQTWSPRSAPASLEPGVVDIWSARLDLEDPTFDRLSRTLSGDEKERAARFKRERDQRRFTSGRGILREILGGYLACPPASVRFEYGHHEKPALASAGKPPPLHFNVAHSADLALYSFTDIGEIGVDVEAILALSDADAIARDYFSPEEWSVFRSLDSSVKLQGFYNCWTRKEALLKASGEGLFRQLDSFVVSLVPGEPARLLRVTDRPEDADRWVLEALAPAPGFVGAVACPGPARLRLGRWCAG